MIATLLTLCLSCSPVTAAAPACSASLQESAENLIRDGRALLALGRATEALPLFEKADALGGGKLATRMWVLRAWLETGRTNDALDAIDKLSKDNKGSEIDYLYGMAFHAVAKQRIAENAGGAIIGMNFADAVTYLKKAAAADAKLYWDAHYALAESAWFAQDLETAGKAAQDAVAAMPKSPEAQYMLGQIAFSQYVAAAGQEGEAKAAAPEHAKRAEAAFQAVEQLLKSSDVPVDRSFRAQAAGKLGNLYCWLKNRDSAVASFGLALGLDPSAVDIGTMLQSMNAQFEKEGPAAFLAALDAGESGFVANWGVENTGDATLLWWLGWARLEQAQYEQAELAFAGAVKKWPQYYNSWFFIALSRYSRQDYNGAITALLRHYEENKDDLVVTVSQNPGRHLAVLDFLIGKCAGERNLEAGMFSEIQGLASPRTSRYWNNAGLFYRDAAELPRRSENAEERARAMQWCEKAYELYSKALELEPENPAYINDTAVMLHYYLDRDLERAKEMYKQANARAKVLLERKDLKPDERELYKIAERDSRNNLARLEKGIKTNG